MKKKMCLCRVSVLCFFDMHSNEFAPNSHFKKYKEESGSEECFKVTTTLPTEKEPAKSNFSCPSMSGGSYLLGQKKKYLFLATLPSLVFCAYPKHH